MRLVGQATRVPRGRDVFPQVRGLGGLYDLRILFIGDYIFAVTIGRTNGRIWESKLSLATE